jgi:hypothetical protein
MTDSSLNATLEDQPTAPHAVPEPDPAAALLNEAIQAFAQATLVSRAVGQQVPVNPLDLLVKTERIELVLELLLDVLIGAFGLDPTVWRNTLIERLKERAAALSQAKPTLLVAQGVMPKRRQ